MGRPKLGSVSLAAKAAKWAERHSKNYSDAARKFGINKSSVSKWRKRKLNNGGGEAPSEE